jgi:hypothetical protein
MSQDYTTSFTVDQTPHQAFAAINNVRGWWTESVKGNTQNLNDEFEVRFEDIHYSKQQVIELIPDQKVVWLITYSHLNFVADKNEWTGTKVIFDISDKGGKTEIRFTHAGLVPSYECYDACSNAWSGYVGSLRSLITTGKGQPHQPQSALSAAATHNYTTAFIVDQTPAEVYAAINNVRGWWSEEVEGSTDSLGIFDYHFKDVHICKIQITELVPNQKVVWLVLDNYFNFTKDKTEWKGTQVIFELAEKDGKTEVRFTHAGLVPDYECFDICSNAWSFYITTSLRELITTGKGQPNGKESTNAVDNVPPEKVVS